MFQIKFYNDIILLGLLDNIEPSPDWRQSLRGYIEEVGGLEGIHIFVNGKLNWWHFMHIQSLKNLNNVFYRLLKGKTVAMADIKAGAGAPPSHLIFQRESDRLIVTTRASEFENLSEPELCDWSLATEEVIQAVRTYRLICEQAARIIAPNETSSFLNYFFPPRLTKEEYETKRKNEALKPPVSFDPAKRIEFVYLDDEDQSVVRNKILDYNLDESAQRIIITNNDQWEPLEKEWAGYLSGNPDSYKGLRTRMIDSISKEANEYRKTNSRPPVTF